MSKNLKVIEAAEMMISRYGKDAVLESELRAKELLENNKKETHAFWIKVKEAVVTLLEKEKS